MALTGWHWTIFGILVAVVSGYTYFYAGRNNAMALFFFIGVVFLIIGLLKLFFRKVDDAQVFNRVKQSEAQNTVHQLPPDNTVQIGQTTLVQEQEPANKVERLINMMAKEQEKPKVHTQAHMHQIDSGYSNSYAKLHQYKGPLKTAANTSAHGTHPINSHVQPKVVNNAEHEHSLKCKKCGNVNHGKSNYCHQCGSRLK